VEAQYICCHSPDGDHVLAAGFFDGDYAISDSSESIRLHDFRCRWSLDVRSREEVDEMTATETCRLI